MNTYKYLLGVALIGLGVSSCSDPLTTESVSVMDGKVIFDEKNETMADAAIMGIVETFGQQNSYRGRFITYFGTNNDAEILNGYGALEKDPATEREISLAVYSARKDNQYMSDDKNVWSQNYIAIERANIAIEGLKESGNINNNVNMGQLYGEALTLRAMIYLDLVKAWGDVPGRFTSISNSPELYIPKTSRTVILKQLLNDLAEAENYLQWPLKNKYTMTTERVNKAFAKGLRARIALFLAGKSQWPTAEGDHVNSELRYNLTDEAERQQMYQIARDECVSLINENVLTLGSFEQNFRNLCQEITTAGQESMYEIPFAEGRGRVCWTYGVKHSDADDWTKLASGGKIGPTPTLWYDYSKDDIRRNITCIPYTWKKGLKSISNSSGGGWSFGKLRYEWMNRVVTSSNDDGLNWQVMRYADVYMMAAEAYNELGDLSNAKKYIKFVMDRAYKTATTVNNKLDAATDKASMFNLIVDERKFEFAGEGLRKVDLMRWGLLSSKMAETKSKMQALANRQSYTDANGVTINYDQYPEKIYYHQDLGATKTEADKYEVYGLEMGDDDDTGKANYGDEAAGDGSSRLFCYDNKPNEDGSKSENDQKVDAFINRLFLNDPNSKMFWPIWEYYINNSNGSLVNDYGY